MSNNIKAVHPSYSATIEDMELMRDSYGGEAVMKAKDVKYLPATPGMVIDGMKDGQPGLDKYRGYKQRAVYPDFVSDAVEFLLGMMHNKEPVIEVPDGMKDMLTKATADGENIYGLLRRINEQQLVTGRVGGMLDFPENPDPSHPLPYIALYNGEAIRNWDESDDNVDFNKLSFVILDESGYKRNGFEWEKLERYRVLTLGNQSEGDTGTDYNYGVYEGANASFDTTLLKTPLVRGAALKEIPFVFINTKDNLGVPSKPPLLPLARAALTVYQGEADYRQALFLQGQDTLVVIGGVKNEAGESETRVGAGAKIEVDIGGDAKYIGVSATGLPELRQALENDYKRSEAKTGQLVNTMGSNPESGNALETRIGAQTATLNQIAKTGAAGLERLLKVAARWLGQDDSKVKVTPNLEFADVRMTGKDLVDFMTAKNLGAPLSNETIHANMAARGVTKMSFSEEMDKIDEEQPIIGSLSGGGAPVLNTPPTPPQDNPPKDKTGGAGGNA